VVSLDKEPRGVLQSDESLWQDISTLQGAAKGVCFLVDSEIDSFLVVARQSIPDSFIMPPKKTGMKLMIAQYLTAHLESNSQLT
jgi:hypothetical protein